MNEDGVRKCPKCGGELENGFLHAGRGIFWDTKEHKWQVLSSQSLIPQWRFTIPRVQAKRCLKCRLVVFEY
jgi:hypothetical protein